MFAYIRLIMTVNYNKLPLHPISKFLFGFAHVQSFAGLDPPPHTDKPRRAHTNGALPAKSACAHVCTGNLTIIRLSWSI